MVVYFITVMSAPTDRPKYCWQKLYLNFFFLNANTKGCSGRRGFVKVAFANSATQAKAWLASGAAEIVARRQHQAGSVKKKKTKLNETLSCCISLYPPCASDAFLVGSEERKSAAAARDCSPFRMSNVLQAVDF